MMKKMISILIALLLIISNVSVWAAEDTAPKAQLLGPSEEYLDYIADPEGFEGDIIPPYINLNQLGSSGGSLKNDHILTPPSLPASYNSNALGYTTSVKNQGSDGTCAVFSTLGTMETFIKKTTSLEYDFSEQHGKLAIASQYSDGTNLYGFNREPNGGAHFSWLTPYLTLARGPVNESEMPYIDGNTYGTKGSIENVNPSFRTTDIKYLLGYGTGATVEQESAWIQSIKEMIYEYGAVSISLTMDTSYMNNEEYFYYCGSEADHNHAVIAVGWDDSVAASNFTINGKTPSRNGALIIKNSWSPYWHGDGYFFYSYDSVGIAAQDAMAITGVESFDHTEKTVNTYAEHGMISSYGYPGYSAPVYYGNKFYLSAGEYVNLDEVTFFITSENMDYEVFVSPTGSTITSDFTLVASGTSDKIGYYTVPVTDMILGDRQESSYYVAVKVYPRTAGVYTIPVELSTGQLVNFVSDYIEYTENGVRKVVPSTTENRQAITAKGLAYSSVSTGYYGLSNYPLQQAENFDIVVSTVTSPVQPTINVSAINILVDNSTCGYYLDFTCVHEPMPVSARVYPFDATNQDYTLVIEQGADLCEYNENGDLYIVPGNATEDSNVVVITAISADGGYTDTVTVNIEYYVPSDVYVFKVGETFSYWALYEYSFRTEVPCQFVDGVTYVPFRVIAQAAGASNIDYNSSTGVISIVNSQNVIFNLMMNSTNCTFEYGGATYSSSLNAAPQYIDGACCLPIRDVSNITGAQVRFHQIFEDGFVLVSDKTLTEDEIALSTDFYYRFNVE